MVDTLAAQVLGFLGLGTGRRARRTGGDLSDLERLCAEQTGAQPATGARARRLRLLGRDAVVSGVRRPGAPSRGDGPDRAAFDRFVSPVLHRLHQRSARHHTARAAGPHGSGYRTQ